MRKPLANREQIIADVLELVGNGTNIVAACRQAGVSLVTLNKWRDADPALAAALVKAKESGSDAIAVEALSIVDARPETYTDKSGNTRLDPAAVAWQKVRADTRLRLLASWAPKQYGNKVDVAGQIEVKHDNPAVQELVALVRAAKRGNAIDLTPRAAIAAPAGNADDAADLL